MSYDSERRDGPDDDALVIRALEGKDSSAIVMLAMRYRREMLAFLSRFIGNVHTAEDVLQVADMKVILAFQHHKFDPSKQFKPWYYAVASNAARDVMRKERRMSFASIDALAHGLNGQEIQVALSDLLEESFSADAHLIFLEDAEWVRGALLRLSPDHQAILRSVYFDERTYSEAAAELGIPLGTVKSRLYAAIQILVRAYHLEHL